METNIHLFITSNSIILIMRNVSDESCKGNQSTHFIFKKLPPPQKTVPFVRKCGKIWPQMTMTRIAHAHCMMDI